MKTEEALEILSGFLIEPIINDTHDDPNMKRVVEIQSDEVERDFDYGSTFEEALIKLGEKYKLKASGKL